MCDVTRDLQTPPFLQTAICTFSETPHFPGGVKYFMHGCKTFMTRHSVIQRRSRPKYSAHAGCYNPRALLMLAPQIGHFLHLELLLLSPIQPQR